MNTNQWKPHIKDATIKEFGLLECPCCGADNEEFDNNMISAVAKKGHENLVLFFHCDFCGEDFEQY